METAHHGIDLLPVIILLAGAVIAAPLAKRLGLGAVLGYLAAGLVIGPFGLGVFEEPGDILQIAELGVVMFLFIIGLEMRPSRLWAMRHQIFGLGFAQVALCAALLTGVGLMTGLSAAVSFVAGAGFVLTSTAIVMQLLEERGELASDNGQRMVAILLLEDLMLVPLLAAVAFLAPIAPGAASESPGIDWAAIGIGAAAIAGLVLAGRFLLNPLFRLLATAQAREVMTAAALLVVLGAAYAMEMGGLSMAMGAFMAGVLLSESSYRHQLEVDVEPFRGVLLGLFFIAVGMSLQIDVVIANWRAVLGYVIAYMLVKALAIYVVARVFGSCHMVAVERAVYMAQGGEFAFVLYSAATAAGILDGGENAMLTAIVILSMVLTPLAMVGFNLLRKRYPRVVEGRAPPPQLTGVALVIGFGRVGQIASQFLFARGYEVSIIDNDAEMVDSAGNFGFKVYYGDGTRLDILRAAGAGHARVVLVCVDKAESATRIVRLLKDDFPDVPVVARANDRRHSVDLIKAGADLQVRETFESAMVMGAAALDRLGASQADILELEARIRDIDRQRLDVEIERGLAAGAAFFKPQVRSEE